MLDHQVDEYGPQICAFGIAGKNFVKHGTTFLHVTVTEL